MKKHAIDLGETIIILSVIVSATVSRNLSDPHFGFRASPEKEREKKYIFQMDSGNWCEEK